MKIEPKFSETAVKLCRDAKKVVQELSSRGVTVEEGNAGLPIMSLETVIPKKNIIRSTTAKRELMIHKMIDGFNDISDITTIEKICTEWHKDLDKMSHDFLTKKLPKKGLHEKHQEYLKTLNKYQIFSDKIYEAILNTRGNKREALSVFEKYVEPIIMKTQEMFKNIDNIPEVKKAYEKASAKAAGKYNTSLSEASHNTQKAKTGSKAIEIAKTNTGSLIEEINTEIASVNTISDASKLITKLEEHKDSMPIEKFEELCQKIIDKIQKEIG